MRFGIHSSKIGSYIIQDAKCGHCHNLSPHRISVFGKYFNLGIVPMFPTGKKVFAECGNCLKTSKKSDFSPSLLLAQKTSKAKSTKPPVWHFTGLILVALFVVYAGIQGNFKDKRELGYINDPNVGDIYYYKVEGDYSSFKIIQMQSDSILVVNNDFMTDKWSGLSDLDKEENYSDYKFSYSKKGLMSMYENGEITSIHRE